MRLGADLTDYDKEVLENLARHHIHCQLDTPPESGIPEDLKIHTYRWYAYLYSSLYKPGDDSITEDVKCVLCKLSDKLLGEHLICWSRDKLIALDPSKLLELRSVLCDGMRSEEVGFHKLRVFLYLFRMLDEDFAYVDYYMTKVLPELLEYAL